MHKWDAQDESMLFPFIADTRIMSSKNNQE